MVLGVGKLTKEIKAPIDKNNIRLCTCSLRKFLDRNEEEKPSPHIFDTPSDRACR
jgi:hypothetical protein